MVPATASEYSTSQMVRVVEDSVSQVTEDDQMVRIDDLGGINTPEKQMNYLGFDSGADRQAQRPGTSQNQQKPNSMLRDANTPSKQSMGSMNAGYY